MAREILLSCDRCSKKHAGKVEVLPFEGRRADGRLLTVDLCGSCWKELEREFGFHDLVRVPRKGFTVLDSASDIPTNSP